MSIFQPGDFPIDANVVDGTELAARLNRMKAVLDNQGLVSSATAPAAASVVIGSIWQDTSKSPPSLHIWDGTVWRETGSADAVVKTPAGGASQTITGDVVVTGSLNVGGGNISPQTGFKNRIINGAMVIDQRNAGASVAANNQYTIDRWTAGCSQPSKYTVQQNAGGGHPPGFKNYLGVTSSSAYSVLAGDNFFLLQAIEGLNVADLGWGTTSAQAVTLSFVVYSSLTGTFGGALVNSAGNRSYPFSYSIPSANTWTTIAVTVPGDTTGAWLTTNGMGIGVRIGLGCGSNFTATANVWGATNATQPTGSVSVVGTSGATFYITGVQLEVGSTATPFEFRSIGQELALCQRYYFRDPTVASLVYNESGSYSSYQFKVTMRAAPTVTTVYATSAVSENGFYALSGGVTGSSVIASAEL